MLNSKLLKKAGNSQKEGKDEDKQDENEKIGGTRYDDTTMNETRNDENDTVEEAKNEVTETIEMRNNENDTVDEVKDNHNVRRSSRHRKQRIDINQDEIGDCDDKNDPDYK